MGIISRDSFVSPISQRYTFASLQRKKLIVGLGNEGEDYKNNRHNYGFMAVDKLADHFGVGFALKKDLKCHLAVAQATDTQIIIIKPTTMMNLSGEAAQAAASFYKIAPGDTLAVYDELDIPFGSDRIALGGSSAGHNGVKSLIQHLGEDFHRLRLGIGPKTPEQMDTADFVLQDFNKDQQKQLDKLLDEAVNKLLAWLEK